MLALPTLLCLTALFPADALLLEEEQVLVTTLDGEEILGTPSLKSVELKTDFGSAKVDLDHVASIHFGEPDLLLTRGDVELRGEVRFKSLRLATEAGKRSIPTKDLASWIAVVDGKRLDVPDVSGAWMTSYGPMELEQEGRTVTGTYGFDRSKLSGRISGNELALDYGSGNSVEFDLWPDGEHLTGEWTSDDNSGTWGAYRQLPVRAEARAGEITQGQTESGLRYYLRVPKDYDDSQNYTAICILHGSNMSARDYVGTFPGAWPELTEKYILVGFDGERMSGRSEEGKPIFNYTYINFGGHQVGPPAAHRQSPALVAEGLDQLAGELPIQRWLVGGHSQGGFLTYAVAMFYPEKLAGAFPMSCNLLVQCDPMNFKDERVRAAQRRLALAPIHGTNDGVVGFSQGEGAFLSFLEGNFPAARFFTDDQAGHMFAHLPVDRAIEWMDDLASGDGARLVAVAEAAVQDKRWRDVGAVAQRLAVSEVDGESQKRLDAALEAYEAAAAKPLAELAPAVLANVDGTWVDAFLDYRNDFAHADSAGVVMASFAKLRQAHQEPADELFWRQRSEQDKGEQTRMRETIVKEYYASTWYALVKGWLED